ncbi:TetR/AcrR family transcriptional regulator [Variovorax ginsengisoli]|uniref:TetR family transcriptional regulator n=1 Tax=Variovorax ginsengisoli TaxID=363844 RepID=A0ABT8SEV9_9BURK|nr:TetR family transcriptional regulator [Variovorax ginsengisoli]MDN8618115.1 TetR family transcriptional regulator [Variovorax ginsengisoli]MDO1537285.1 TetR family transcriptional regulator [Variovorax ginsengisoli]
MRVTKAQAQENRTRIIETAATLFRERGYDGVSVAELMSIAGFTHGGFYNHFRSKADLVTESAALGFSRIAAGAGEIDLVEFVNRYVSRAHRDARGSGCTVAALCGDAARQSDDVKAMFKAGIEAFVTVLAGECGRTEDEEPGAARAKAINILAHSIGAMVLSRACPDASSLADEILDVSRTQILEALPKTVAAGSPQPRHDGHLAQIGGRSPRS